MDDSEIIGKTVKDLEGIDFRETGPVLRQKKYLILGLAVIMLLIIIAGIVSIYMSESSVAPPQAGPSNEGEGFVTFTEQAEEPADRQQANEQPVNQQTPAGDIIYYKIQEGDCFEKIAVYYYGKEIYASELARYNKIEIDSILSIGQVIKVPREAGMLKQ